MCANAARLFLLTSLLPETLIAGAAPVVGGVVGEVVGGVVGAVVGGVVGGVVGAVVGGVVVVVPPVQVTPLSVNEAGAGLAPDHDPVKPTEALALVASEPLPDDIVVKTGRVPPIVNRYEHVPVVVRGGVTVPA